MNSFVGAFHDAVILYALALNETLEANMSISDGEAITRRMWNRTFDGESTRSQFLTNGSLSILHPLKSQNAFPLPWEKINKYSGYLTTRLTTFL